MSSLIFYQLITGLKLTEADQELYKNFPLVISERWQTEVMCHRGSGGHADACWCSRWRFLMLIALFQVAETVFDTINHEYDKAEQKKAKQKNKAKFSSDEKESDVILHGYIKKLVRKGE